jgi:hypothetical protein
MAIALIAFRRAIILLAREGALPLIGGKVDNFLTQQALISSAGIDQDPMGLFNIELVEVHG